MFSFKNFVNRRLALVVVALAGLFTSPAFASDTQTGSEATRLRILLVIDTEGDPHDWLGLDLSRKQVQATLEAALKQQGLSSRYTIDVLTGADVTRAKVLGYYETLETNSSEALLFYYFGHG